MASNLHSARARPGGSASFCAPNQMVTARQAGGRTGGASRRGPRGRPSPGKTRCKTVRCCSPQMK
eukprot:15454458-Alexandrium_andersonii.AAC.1